jgi:hypothetical protein
MSVPRLVSALASNPDLNPWLLVCPYATSYPKGALTAGDSTVGVLKAKATTVESLTDTGDASVGGKLTVTGKGACLWSGAGSNLSIRWTDMPDLRNNAVDGYQILSAAVAYMIYSIGSMKMTDSEAFPTTYQH